jgi:hypothetical protein
MFNWDFGHYYECMIITGRLSHIMWYNNWHNLLPQTLMLQEQSSGMYREAVIFVLLLEELGVLSKHFYKFQMLPTTKFWLWNRYNWLSDLWICLSTFAYAKLTNWQSNNFQCRTPENQVPGFCCIHAGIFCARVQYPQCSVVQPLSYY